MCKEVGAIYLQRLYLTEKLFVQFGNLLILIQCQDRFFFLSLKVKNLSVLQKKEEEDP